MKTYRGFSDSLHESEPCIVLVQDAAGWRPLPRLTGPASGAWGWGHGGGGAAELARSLLADHLGYVPPPVVCQRFLWEVVGRWAQGWRWRCTSADIDAWLARARRRGVIPSLAPPDTAGSMP